VEGKNDLVMDPMDEESVIERCRAGDLDAYRQVYDRYGQPLLRTATRLLGSLQEAEDAVQETFLKLFRGIGGFQGRARFSTYLFQILHNTCFDVLRRRKPSAGDAAEMNAQSVPSTDELASILAQAVDSLPLRMKACFVLFAVEQYSHQEVADILGVNVGTVKTSIHRARGKLRAWLGSLPAGGVS
jgi:RNA polymerase sigma-70 factor (ECF subfamily)